MSYRNPARIVDVQSGQHFRNMQQSLAKSFQGTIDQDTARIKANMLKAEKEQAELRKKLQKQEDEAYRTALQANQQTNTSVRYDNMQDNLSYNAHLAGKPAGSLTSEERVWMQNFKNVGSSIKTVLANIVSGREDYEKQSSIRPGEEGSIAATPENVQKQKAYEIFLNGNGGTSHAYFDGATGETTIIAKDLKGVEVGRVTSNGDAYEFATVPVSKEDADTNVKALLTSIKNESISSAVYGENPVSTPIKDSSGNTTSYFLKPVKENVIDALYTPSLATVQSWTPDQQKNWYNSTQKGKPGFKMITDSWTEDGKYAQEKGGKMVPNKNVKIIAEALANKTFNDNSVALMQNRPFGKEKIKELKQLTIAQQTKLTEDQQTKETKRRKVAEFDKMKGDLSLKGIYKDDKIDYSDARDTIVNIAGQGFLGVDVLEIKDKPDQLLVKSKYGTFTITPKMSSDQVREILKLAAHGDPETYEESSDNKGDDKTTKDVFGNEIK